MAIKPHNSSEYSKLLKDPRWQKMRLEVMERDRWTCQACGETKKTLHAHHLFYMPGVEGPWDYDASGIITLCEDCHEDEHLYFQYRGANVLEAAAKAGFRTNEELGTLHDMLSVLGLAATDEDAFEMFLVMARSHLRTLRERIHGSN